METFMLKPPSLMPSETDTDDIKHSKNGHHYQLERHQLALCRYYLLALRRYYLLDPILTMKIQQLMTIKQIVATKSQLIVVTKTQQSLLHLLECA